MNPKLKKAVSIIGLVFMGLFLISMTIFFVNSELFGGMLWLVALLCFGISVVMFCAIYFTRSFPAQQAKAEELKRLENEYYKKLAEKEEAEKEEAEKENAEKENSEKENVGDNKD